MLYKLLTKLNIYKHCFAQYVREKYVSSTHSAFSDHDLIVVVVGVHSRLINYIFNMLYGRN